MKKALERNRYFLHVTNNSGKGGNIGVRSVKDEDISVNTVIAFQNKKEIEKMMMHHNRDLK